MDPTDGSLTDIGKTSAMVSFYTPTPRQDMVLIAIDASRDYLTTEMKEIPDKALPPAPRDLTE